MKGPALFLAPFVQSEPPFNSLASLADWTAANGYRGVQIPTWDERIFDLEAAAISPAYCDEVRGTFAERGLELADLSAEMQARLLAVPPAWEPLVAGLAPAEAGADARSRYRWAARQMLFAVQAARNLGLRGVAAVSGGFLAPFHGSGLAWPEGLAETAFTELCRRWRPVLDAAAEAEVDLCFEPRPGQDVQDGVTFERFLAGVGGHPRCRLAFNPAHLLLQQIDYLSFLDTYRERIGLFHAADAELEPGARQALLSAYGPPRDRPARPRAPGDGQVDFAGICGRLAAHEYGGWAVVHWACAVKHPLAGARDAAELLAAAMVRTPPPEPPRPADEPLNRRVLGLP